MRSCALIFLCFILIGIADGAPVTCTSHLRWDRAEANQSGMLLMGGTAVVVKSEGKRTRLRLTEDSPQISPFDVVLLQVEGSRWVAEFLPPNTEPTMLRLNGVVEVQKKGEIKFATFADGRSGNLLSISKRCVSKTTNNGVRP